MKRITFRIRLLAPVLCTRPGSDPNTEVTHDYIPGSVLRGALVARYLRTKGKSSKNQAFETLFLNGDTRYLNSYPTITVMSQDEAGAATETFLPSEPVPYCWQMAKDPPIDSEDAIEAARHVYNLLLEEGPGASRGVPGAYAAVVNGTVHPGRVAYEMAVHNQRDRAKGRATDDVGALFRYQALASRQTFDGEIHVDDETLVDEITSLLNGKLWLGGSQSAGYGEAEVELLGEPADPHAAPEIKKGERVICLLASDAILPHSRTGQEGNDIRDALTPFFPAASPPPGVADAFTRMAWVGGFNAKWGMPLPQSWAVNKGSVWTFEAQTDIPSDIITDLQNRGIGARRAEGFGQIRINSELVSRADLVLAGDGREAQQPVATNGSVAKKWPELTTDEQKSLDRMNRRIAIAMLDRRLAKSTHELATSYKGKLSPSQFGRLRVRIRQAHTNGLADFVAYLDDTTKRRTADEQFRTSRLEKQDFREWMKTLAENPATVWDELNLSDWKAGDGTSYQKQFLGDQPFSLTDKLATDYTIRLIESVCEQISRRERK